MNGILKSAKFDLALVLPYYRRAAFMVLLMPLLYAYFINSILTSVSFSMCMAAILSCYTFSISEKNDMEKLYGILPVSKKELVLGRYLFTMLAGLTVLIISILSHPLVLAAFRRKVSMKEIVLTAAVGTCMFVVYTVFQLPGYYKYGSLRAKFFMYIPLAGYFLISYLFGSSPEGAAAAIRFLVGHPWLAAAAILLGCLAALALSILLSIRITEKKEI